MARTGNKQNGATTLFARAAACYWLSIFPQLCRALRYWQRRAAEIPDAALRRAALDALDVKRGDLEGAVAFAVFAPTAVRRTLVGGIAAWEIAFDYLDSIGEMPNPDPIANGQTLNQALLAALQPGGTHPKYYALHMREGDGGYLAELVDTCRRMVERLPSFNRVADTVWQVVSRIAAYQSLNHGDTSGSHAAFADWARTQALPGADLKWWEIAAATGSQLTFLALMTAAASARLTDERVASLESAYFPWIGALSTLLDSLVDQPRDNTEGQFNLINYYDSPQQAAQRLGMIAQEAVAHIRDLPDARDHALLLAAMAAFFHTQARSKQARLATRAILAAVGSEARPALVIFRARYGIARITKPAATALSPIHHC